MSRTVRTLKPGWHDRAGESYDRKPWHKPGSDYKQITKRRRRAVEHSAMASGRLIPVFRKSDAWDYL